MCTVILAGGQGDPANVHLPATEELDRREVTLPSFPTITQEKLDAVIAAVRDALATA